VLTVRAPITKRVIGAMERCRIIVRYGIGGSTRSTSPLRPRAAFMVANVPDYCVDEVSDHALTLLLMLSRQMISAISLAKEERWVISKMPAIQGCEDKRAAWPAAAKSIASRRQAAALGMRILIHDPYLNGEPRPRHRRGTRFARGIARTLRFFILAPSTAQR